MRTIWERFENAFGNAVINTSARTVSTRHYTIDVAGVNTLIDAEYQGADILRITSSPNQPPAGCSDMLRAGWTMLFWRYALRSGSALLQTDVFADDFRAAPEILSAMNSSISPNEINGSLICNDNGGQTREDIDLQRLRATLQGDLPVPVKEREGVFSFELQPAGTERSYHLRCAPVRKNVLRVTSTIVQRVVDTPSVARYLLRRNRDLVGCKASLDPTGVPVLISDIPLSTIEHEGAARRLALFADCLADLRPLLSLHDPGVGSMYQHITNHQQGDIQHGHIA